VCTNSGQAHCSIHWAATRSRIRIKRSSAFQHGFPSGSRSAKLEGLHVPSWGMLYNSGPQVSTLSNKPPNRQLLSGKTTTPGGSEATKGDQCAYNLPHICSPFNKFHFFLEESFLMLVGGCAWPGPQSIPLGFPSNCLPPNPPDILVTPCGCPSAVSRRVQKGNLHSFDPDKATECFPAPVCEGETFHLSKRQRQRWLKGQQHACTCRC